MKTEAYLWELLPDVCLHIVRTEGPRAQSLWVRNFQSLPPTGKWTVDRVCKHQHQHADTRSLSSSWASAELSALLLIPNHDAFRWTWMPTVLGAQTGEKQGAVGNLPSAQAVKVPAANSSSQHIKWGAALPEADNQPFQKLPLVYPDLSSPGDLAQWSNAWLLSHLPPQFSGEK
jgi:hypothetical protein